MTTINSGSVSGIHYETGEFVKVHFSDGIITGIDRVSGETEEEGKLILAPGLIDNQTNGYADIDFQDDKFNAERMRLAARSIWKDGVTTFVPTLVTESRENLLRNFRILAETVKDPDLYGSVTGFHLEGPWLSPEKGFYGCHNAKHLRRPSVEEFRVLQEAAGGRIIITTIAPELEGSDDLISYCYSNGVVVSIGHTNATTKQINKAVDYGARMSTHLFNGCANMINRHRNPLWPQLANDLLTPSVIADGFHLLPEELAVIYKVKGKTNMILTSDVTHLAGMDPGEYRYMGSRVVMEENGRIFNPSLNCLAGASSPLKKGISVIMQATGCKLSEALDMAAKNVARVLGLGDRGVIETGKRADLILLKIKDGMPVITGTWVAGVNVYSKDR